MSLQPQIDKIVRAWLDPGRVPAYHEHIKAKLYVEWPVLANAIEELVYEDGI